MDNPIELKEHEFRSFKEIKEINEIGVSAGDIPDGEKNELEIERYWKEGKEEGIKAKYKIGADWLIENKLPILVRPKMDNLDYVKMFSECLKELPWDDNRIQQEISQSYGYNFGKSRIELKYTSINTDIDVILIQHYIAVLKRIVRKGLIKNYIDIEENLRNKIKGKILFGRHVRKNVLTGNVTRNFCRYQNYTEDCVENRILKKALRYAITYLKDINFRDSELLTDARRIIRKFERVSDDYDAKQVLHYKFNSVYKEYKESIKIARMILERFNFSIYECENTETTMKIPPFWINMWRLFELYVLAKLQKAYGDEIKYQFKSEGTRERLDFIKKDEQTILDAKYQNFWNEHKKWLDKKYKNPKRKEIIDAIRQLSGYARNKSFRKEFEVEDNHIMKCVIVYPDENGKNDFDENKVVSEDNEIGEYISFYKIGIKLPPKNNNATSKV